MDLNWFEKTDLEKLIRLVIYKISLCNVKSIEKFLEVIDEVMIPCPHHNNYKGCYHNNKCAFKCRNRDIYFRGTNLSATAISHLINFLKNVSGFHVDVGAEETGNIICKTIILKSYCRCEDNRQTHHITHSIIKDLKNIIDCEREHYYSIYVESLWIAYIDIRYF